MSKLTEILLRFERIAAEAKLDNETTDVQMVKILENNRNEAEQAINTYIAEQQCDHDLYVQQCDPGCKCDYLHINCTKCDYLTTGTGWKGCNLDIAEVIVEDEPVGLYITNVTGGLPTQPAECRNFLREEQRKRAGL